jgi:nucleoside-diphosphate-sugar epimerase
VTGATGNIGTALVRRLTEGGAAGPACDVTGLSRRPPRGWAPPGLTWERADLATDPPDRLAALFDGADAVVHLAVLFQPSHHSGVTWRVNCHGTARVFDAVAAAGVPALVHASSLVAYSPAPKDRRVDESWPTHGWPTAHYCREKAYAERLLDAFERRHPGVRAVRLRPAIVLGAASAAQQRRLFGGAFFPSRRLPAPLRVIPDLPGLRFQAVHTDDAADAFHRAVLRPDAAGAYNIAAEPVVDAALLARAEEARTVRVPYPLLRGATTTAWHLRLLPTSPWMLDAVLGFPLMDTARARRELDWRPAHSAGDAVAAFLAGLRERRGGPTPPLRAGLRGGRAGEAATGAGERS